MISITCTNCRTTLEMDEAFAGGVCRCQFCGTIQTVPSNLKATASAAKSFYTAPAKRSGGGGAPPAESSGLDDLANAVSSSGLSNSGLRSRQVPAPSRAAGVDYRTPAPAAPNKQWLLIGGGAVILLLLGVIALMFLRSSPSNAPVVGPATPGGPTTPGGAPPVVTAGPNFAGLGLDGGGKVVYVVDRGNSTERFFDPLKYAISKSIESLGSGNQFAVVFWRRTSDADASMAEMSFPDAGLANASPDQSAAFLRKFQDLTAGGATNIEEAIREAVARKPSAIVIATAKDDLNLDGVAEAVDKARGSNNIKIHAVTLGGTGTSTVLKSIAAKAGGKYVQVDERTLQDQ